MIKLKLLSASVVLAFGLGISGSAYADISIDSVTVDGGASVSVLAGADIEVIVTVSGTDNTNWQCGKYQIEGEALSGDFAGNHNTNQIVGETETFDITAPGTNGVYDLVIDIWDSNGCSGASDDTRTLTDAIIVGTPSAPLSKSLVSGPLTTSKQSEPAPTGCNGIAACGGFAAGYEALTGPNDHGAIGLNLDFSQHFVVEILIENEGGDGAINDNVIADTFGADIDRDPTAHEDWLFGGFPLDGVCDDLDADQICDGELDGTPLDGFVVDGDCTAEMTQPPSGDGIGLTKEPEFIDILVGDLDEGVSCSILVFVQTVKNPGGGNDFWEPTGCRILAKGTDIQDTFTLNEGLKDFDASGDRLSGPLGSLQLTCIPLD